MSDKWMPPKPPFYTMVRRGRARGIDEERFNLCYDIEIRPLFENAIKVYGTTDNFVFSDENSSDEDDTHKAILIKIEPIKKADTAESILREIMDVLAGSASPLDEPLYPLGPQIKKAKQFLEKK